MCRTCPACVEPVGSVIWRLQGCFHCVSSHEDMGTGIERLADVGRSVLRSHILESRSDAEENQWQCFAPSVWLLVALQC